ncbi:MAG TPA: VWA domain-containing protein [Candidatus Acidoferrum sp.]|nr:VWA domain-containing protein [Candidatus Acidoferrum sp.]
MLLSNRCRAVLSFAFTFSLVPRAFPQQTAQTSPDIHVSVDRVNVGVVVTDSRGQFVGGLSRKDFHIFDDGAEQPITDFLSVDGPAQVLILIEAGPAVYLLQGAHLQAVHALLAGLAPSDRVAIARYNEAAEPILNFTPDKLVAAGALDQLQFNLGFGQLNLASSLATALDWLERVPGKKSLVLLSTGIDTSRPAAIDNLLARLKSADVRVLAVSLGGELRVPQTAEKNRSKKVPATPQKTLAVNEALSQADAELKAIAQSNGGRAYFPLTRKDFAEVFTQIAQLVRHEYNLGFVPPAHDGRIHSIDVRVADSTPASSSSASSDAPPTSAFRVDHRQAYVAPPTGQP